MLLTIGSILHSQINMETSDKFGDESSAIYIYRRTQTEEICLPESGSLLDSFQKQYSYVMQLTAQERIPKSSGTLMMGNPKQRAFESNQITFVETHRSANQSQYRLSMEWVFQILFIICQ